MEAGARCEGEKTHSRFFSGTARSPSIAPCTFSGQSETPTMPWKNDLCQSTNVCILCKSLVFGNWEQQLSVYLWQCIHDTVTKQIWSIWSVKRTSSLPSRSASDATTCSSSFFPVTLMIFCLVFQYFCWNLFTTDESWLSIKRSKYSRE